MVGRWILVFIFSNHVWGLIYDNLIWVIFRVHSQTRLFLQSFPLTHLLECKGVIQEERVVYLLLHQLTNNIQGQSQSLRKIRSVFRNVIFRGSNRRVSLIGVWVGEVRDLYVEGLPDFQEESSLRVVVWSSY
jgi:hypothetical protein